MKRAIDTYALGITINFEDRECDVRLPDGGSLAQAQDLIAAVIEQYPQATSFLITMVRVTHTFEEHELN